MQGSGVYHMASRPQQNISTFCGRMRQNACEIDLVYIMKKKKVLFWGTPAIAAHILQMLAQSNIFEISAVVTNPDAPQGRGQQMMPSPVKETAGKINVPVLTPHKLDNDFFQALDEISADLFLVVAYGKILPQKFLDLPSLGAYNLHFSLLPKYRGASPVQSTLLTGEKMSGFSIFRLTKEMDAGDIFVQEEMNIFHKNSQEVFDNMVQKGGKALVQFTENMCEGKQGFSFTQDDRNATYCQKLKKSDGQIFPEKETTEEILRKYRAFYLWPGTYYVDPKTNTRIKLLKIAPFKRENTLHTDSRFSEVAGECVFKTVDGVLAILNVQVEGKKPMSGMEFWNFWKQD